MISMFGRRAPILSLIAIEVIDCIYNVHSHKITEWIKIFVSPTKLQLYADAVHRKGAALSNSFGYVNSIVRLIRRPENNNFI